MKKSLNIALIGGDGRAAYAARYFCSLGYEVGYCSCQGDMGASAVRIESVGDALGFADAAVLPIPVSRDSKTLSYSGGVLLSQIIRDLPSGKKIFIVGGMIPGSFKDEAMDRGAVVLDFALSETYLQSSADLTVPAFFDFIKDKGFSPLENKKIAVCGLGRIGKGLTRVLCRQNTQINVLSGNAHAYEGKYPENVSIYGYDQAAEALADCDAVINTAPAHVLHMDGVKAIPENAVFYELASAPFGIDGDCARYLGSRYVKALGLPGIYYPKESGELIAVSVLELLTNTAS